MKIKKLLTGILAAAIAVTAGSIPEIISPSLQKELTAGAAELKYGDYLTYKIIESGITDEKPEIMITGCDKSAVSVDIPSEINGMTVTSIGYMAIHWCQSLESVTIPDTVTSIGAEAFYWCDSLQSITIPESVTSIGAEAFNFCDKLEYITIPGSVTSIGNRAFCNTAWLRARQAESPFVIVNNILIDGTTCSGDIVIPDDVTSIGESSFKNCDELKSVTIHKNVTSIGQDAFFRCKVLESVTIENPECEIHDGYEFYENSSTIFNAMDEKNKRYYDGVIRGYENSTAQEYAENCKFRFESIGEYTPPVTEPSVITTTEVSVPVSEGIISSAPSETETEIKTTINTITTEPEKIKGDISGNGKIDLYDAIEIAKYLVKTRDFTDAEKETADFNGDGKVNLYDAIEIAKYIIDHKN